MAGTKERILAAARELFAQQGVQKTSMRDISERLGITKPALYYHFTSREDLVRSIVQPLIEGGLDLVARYENAPRIEPRELLEAYFDYHYAHRDDLLLLFNELATLAELGLVELVLGWRTRLMGLLVGPEPTLTEATGAVVALGGLQDCTIQFRDIPADELRDPAVNAAMAALGL
ncbi:TetR/AcrR family transcriptional regulator [Actinocrispum wychmicini]|uniref:TetR family transcriptional regulator n=1 Tax=Actinocrispum wychmicini TaxID=1213861 RepID=A0A4R2JU82_9PSEU|nr:TetR/AcrR family transcriptional regulator [Actinocrispum wychmicini]TCO62592.1 TetR family transcriptional regulator [Actinocrispum wychmicini]